MKRDQINSHADDVKDKSNEAAGKATDHASTECAHKAKKQGGKGGAVLAEVNDDAKKKPK